MVGDHLSRFGDSGYDHEFESVGRCVENGNRSITEGRGSSVPPGRRVGGRGLNQLRHSFFAMRSWGEDSPAREPGSCGVRDHRLRV